MMRKFMVCVLLAWGAGVVQAGDVIKVAQIHRFQSQGDMALHFFRGVELAIAQTNAAGGVAGKKLDLITRDDGGSAPASRAALVALAAEPAGLPDVILGGYDSESAQAIAAEAQAQRRPYLATAPLPVGFIGAPGGRYSFAVAPAVTMQTAALALEAAKLGKKRWAVIYPDDERGRSGAQAFAQQLAQAQPGVEIVARQALASAAGSEKTVASALQALTAAGPEAIFSALLGADLVQMVGAVKADAKLSALSWVALQAGEPEQLDPLAADMPAGWLVSGYPWYALNHLAHDGFIYAYTKRYKDYPRALSVLGYSAVETLVAALRKTQGKADADALIAAMQGLSVQTPLGPITYGAKDHQSSMGTVTGQTAMLRGKAAMARIRWHGALR